MVDFGEREKLSFRVRLTLIAEIEKLKKEKKDLLNVVKNIKAKTEGAAWIGIGSPKSHKRIDVSREDIKKMNDLVETIEGE